MRPSMSPTTAKKFAAALGGLWLGLAFSALASSVSAQDVSRRLVTRAFYSNNASAVVASAATVAPVNAIVHISGTAAVGTITVPAGCSPTCSIYLVPDGLFTWTAAGNISIAGSAVVNRVITFVWDGAKWNPSYIS